MLKLYILLIWLNVLSSYQLIWVNYVVHVPSYGFSIILLIIVKTTTLALTKKHDDAYYFSHFSSGIDFMIMHIKYVWCELLTHFFLPIRLFLDHNIFHEYVLIAHMKQTLLGFNYEVGTMVSWEEEGKTEEIPIGRQADGGVVFGANFNINSPHGYYPKWNSLKRSLVIYLIWFFRDRNLMLNTFCFCNHAWFNLAFVYLISMYDLFIC